MGKLENLIEMKGITKTFPGVKALDNVELDLKPGEVHILLGENGAGKSTLMKIIAGAYVPDSGELRICGQLVETFSPRFAQKLGVGIIYQEFNLVPYLNVAQNIYLDHMPKKWGGLAIDHKKMHKDAESILKSLNMHVDTYAESHEISAAQQQMVEGAKALTHDSQILIMDEPTASLSDREIEQLFKTIKELTSKGIGIIYISHRLQELSLIGDRVTVLRDGKYIGTYNIKDVTTDQLVTKMVGRELSTLYDRDFIEKGELALKVENLSSEKSGLKNINVDVYRGEIVGIAGLVGSGRTELARAIFHVDTYDTGKITLLGEELFSGSPQTVISKGLSLIPEDRKRQGLSLILSVAENVVMSSLKRIHPRGYISNKRESSVVNTYVEDLRIATPNIKQLAKNLSGGNQQKVVLAKWLCTEAEIFIFDEPTRGIDVGAKGEIHSFMNKLVKAGKAVMMISSELPEVIGMSDRVYVMREGRIVAEYDKDNVTQEKVIADAMGAEEEQEGEA